MATVANLDVTIGAKTAGLKKGIAGAKSQMNSLKSTVLKLAGAFGVAFGVQQIFKFIKRLE